MLENLNLDEPLPDFSSFQKSRDLLLNFIDELEDIIKKIDN